MLNRSDMESLTEKIKEIEKEEILNALKECKWVMSKAARKLGITERMIGYKIKKHQIIREVTYIGDGFKSDG
jgi:Nif-specific regulatory protein